MICGFPFGIGIADCGGRGLPGAELCIQSGTVVCRSGGLRQNPVLS